MGPEIEEIDDVPDLEEIDDDGVPELEEVGAGGGATAGLTMPEQAPTVQNRNEKKARKAMQKLGMRPVPGILRVTVKKSKNVLFAINKLVISTLFTNKPTPDMPDLADIDGGGDDEEAIDETGLDAKDIELVVSQAGCSRSKAVKALKENDGDLVNSIMSLTK